MNKRLRELVKQHGVNITIDGLGYGEGNIEGLAELIVRECLGIIDEEGSHEGGSIRSMEAIKQHFGVEE